MCSSYAFAFFPTAVPFRFRVLRALLHLRSSAAVVAVALLVHPGRFQFEVALNLVCNLLGWGAPALARRIRVGASLLGGLAAGEFVLFVSCLFCGLVLPISPFFLWLLEKLFLQHQRLMAHPILKAAIFAHLCEMSVGVALLSPASGRKGAAQRLSEGGNQAELRLHLSLLSVVLRRKGAAQRPSGGRKRAELWLHLSLLPELSCAFRNSPVSSPLNFTSTWWYASMNWSSSNSVSAARPPSVVCYRASISLALMALTSPPTMRAPSP
jgi:hypothetical protein